MLGVLSDFTGYPVIWGKITFGDRVYLFGVFPIITGVLKMAIIIVTAICKWVNPLQQRMYWHISP